MSRRPPIAALGAILLALPVAAQAQSATAQSRTAQSRTTQSGTAQSRTTQSGTTQSPAKESGSPIADQGSSYNYRSYITSVVPNVPGVSLQVLEFADRLVLTNRSGQTVTVYGYQGEPYARVLADGTVQLNTRSPAYYLNQSFYGDVNVPSSASASASPRWTVVDRTGQLEWHDHRIHWMSPVPPPQVKDRGKRTKIFNWRVPIQVGSRKGAVDGELFWTPAGGSKAPAGAIVALAAIVVLGLLLALFVRRRRSRAPVGASAGGGEGADRSSPGEPDRPVKEVW